MKKVSRRTIDRALLYIRTLEGLIKEKRSLISSKELGGIMGISDVQIRKDISSCGRVGTSRVGYPTAELKNRLEDLVLQNNVVRVVLFGVGNLGTAILKYPGFDRNRVRLVAAFDTDVGKIGKIINGVEIYPLTRAVSVIRQKRAHIGIMAIPSDRCQPVADLMVKSGLRGIVNFAPVSLTVPKGAQVKNIDLTIEFLSLFANLGFSSRRQKRSLS